jgi:hypothetical protein
MRVKKHPTLLSLSHIHLIVLGLKGTVQRELREVKIGINRFLMMYSPARKCPLPLPQGLPSREEHKRYQRL